jgi:hypothetical protein
MMQDLALGIPLRQSADDLRIPDDIRINGLVRVMRACSSRIGFDSPKRNGGLFYWLMPPISRQIYLAEAMRRANHRGEHCLLSSEHAFQATLLWDLLLRLQFDNGPELHYSQSAQ